MWLHVPGEREPATLAHPFSIWMLVGGKPECVQSGDVDWRKTPWAHVLDLWSNDESKRRRVDRFLARPRASLTTLSLCSGYGGLDRAVEHATGSETIVYVERQAYAAAVLAERMRTGDIAQAPIWDDLETFDTAPWRGRVDIVCAGFPCQGASVAGKRQGVDDERWLWPLVWKIVREVGASFLFFENVPGLLSVNGGAAFEAIIGDLGASGWSCEWDCLPAAAIGAPHIRDRLFCLAANPNSIELRIESERDQRKGGGGGGEGTAERRHAEPAHDGGARRTAADADGSGRIARSRDLRARQSEPEDGRDASLGGDQATDASGERRDKGQLRRTREGRRRGADATGSDREAGSARIATDPDSAGRTGRGHRGQLDERERQKFRGDAHGRSGAWPGCTVGERLAAIAERGREHWAWGNAPIAAVRGVDDGTASGMDEDSYHEELHLLGNGVVALCAEAAFEVLRERLYADEHVPQGVDR